MQDFLFLLLPTDKARSAIARRLAAKIDRIFQYSPRMQRDPERHKKALGRHWIERMETCLSYKDCGHTLVRKSIVGMVCHYFSRNNGRFRSALGVKADLLEEFLQEFCIEALRAFRRESNLREPYRPTTRLERAEFFAFWDHYAKRSVHFSRGSQTIARLRAQSFIKSRSEWREVSVSFDTIDGAAEDGLSASESGLLQRVRDEISEMPVEAQSEAIDAWGIVQALESWLEERGQQDCITYLRLRMEDAGVERIEAEMGLTKRQRDYLQQKFRYHADKFLVSDVHWRLAHSYLEASTDELLGLSESSWEEFADTVANDPKLDPEIAIAVLRNLDLETDEEIARASGCTPYKAYRARVRILQIAKELRKTN